MNSPLNATSRVFASLDQLIDACVICMYGHRLRHTTNIIAALEAGKHVLWKNPSPDIS
jgi:predicted dehydrogenase